MHTQSTELRAGCVAQACAYMNDAGLPNPYWLARHLSEMLAILDKVNAYPDPRIDAARNAVDQLRPHLPANL